MATSSAIPLEALKAVACDMDETLLTSSDKSISQPNLEALVSLSQSGVSVLLASGRHLSSMFSYYEQLCQAGVTPGPIISCNGALVTIDDKVVVRDGLEVEVARILINFCEAQSVQLNYYLEEKVYSAINGDLEAEVHIEAYQKLTGQAVVRIASVTEEGLLDGELPPLKLLFFATEDKLPALLEAVRALYKSHGFSPHLINGHFFGEVMKEGASKASALTQVMPHLGLTLSHVASFGDGNNDAEMLDAAGVGVAVANAQPRAKLAADVVSVLTNNESAVAHEISTLARAGRFGETARVIFAMLAASRENPNI